MELQNKPILSRTLLDKMNFDFFVKYQLEHEDAASKSSNSQTYVDSDTGSVRECNDNYKATIAMIVYILTWMANQLSIINHGFEEKHEVEALLEIPKRKPLREKFEEGLRNKLFYEPTLEIYKDSLANMIRFKLAYDIMKLNAVVDATITELHFHGTFKSLDTKINYIEQETEEIHDIIYDYVKSEEYLKYLEVKEKAAVEYLQNLKDGWAEEWQLLLESRDDCSIESSIETRLIRKWMQTRLEQREIAIDMEREELTNQLNDLNKCYQNETDITSDIEEFLDFKIAEVDNMIEKWMTKCDTDIEAMDDEIQLLTEGNAVLEICAQKAKDEYNSRKEEMENYWEVKRLAAEAILLAQKQIQFAIRIQAWWRGTMVRRHLGPFRKRKRKGKGKNKGKKKK